VEWHHGILHESDSSARARISCQATDSSLLRGLPHQGVPSRLGHRPCGMLYGLFGAIACPSVDPACDLSKGHQDLRAKFYNKGNIPQRPPPLALLALSNIQILTKPWKQTESTKGGDRIGDRSVGVDRESMFSNRTWIWRFPHELLVCTLCALLSLLLSDK